MNTIPDKATASGPGTVFQSAGLNSEGEYAIIRPVSRSGGMADAADSKSVGLKTVRVQVPPSARKKPQRCGFFRAPFRQGKRKGIASFQVLKEILMELIRADKGAIKAEQLRIIGPLNKDLVFGVLLGEMTVPRGVRHLVGGSPAEC